MEWVDSHCHVDFPEFDADRGEMLAEARRQGVHTLLIPAVWPGNFERVMAMQSFPGVRIALGLHPCWLNSIGDDALTQLEQALVQCPEAAVGECGLDRFEPGLDWSRQVSLFEAQLALARRHRRPLVLHVRRAHADAIRLLKLQPPLAGGIVHAFAGSAEEAREYRKLGLLLGIGGAATHPRAQRLRRVVVGLPAEQLLLETDAPDMSPAWARGQRNSPLQLPRLGEWLAELRGVTVEDVAATTSANFQRVFGTH